MMQAADRRDAVLDHIAPFLSEHDGVHVAGITLLGTSYAFLFYLGRGAENGTRSRSLPSAPVLRESGSRMIPTGRNIHLSSRAIGSLGPDAGARDRGRQRAAIADHIERESPRNLVGLSSIVPMPMVVRRFSL